MAIYKKKPTRVYRCNDGTFSSHNRRGACNWHQGLKTGKAIKLSICKQGGADAGIELVPLQAINVRHEWFQNRTAPYSLRSVHNIISAVQKDEFKWANLDAVTLWRAPDRKLYVLSGHSRHEAFRQLCKAGMEAERRNFCAMPAKIVSTTLEEAKKIALESNTLSTKETPLERAEFYRTQRSGGADAGAIIEIAKRLEGRNWPSIIAFSHLNPIGRTWAGLKALQNGQAESRSTLTSIASWIGKARQRYAQLTNGHEDELYAWLVTQKGYGTSRGQVNSYAKFKQRIETILHKRTYFGRLDPMLNIQESITRTPVEQQYNEQLDESNRRVMELEKELKRKTQNYTAGGVPEEKILELTKNQRLLLIRARKENQRLKGKLDEVRQAAKNQTSLFAGVGSTGSNSFVLPALILVGLFLYTR